MSAGIRFVGIRPEKARTNHVPDGALKGERRRSSEYEFDGRNRTKKLSADSRVGNLNRNHALLRTREVPLRISR